MEAIRVEDLRKHFDGVKAVDGISFEVEKGEIFGFLGPNGAGKTTTVRLITGILVPDSGKAWVNGKDVGKAKIQVQEGIGIVPEVSNPYVDLSAWQNLMLMGGLYGMERAKREARSEELIELFGLADRRNSPVKKFSKGMKRKLVLAMALIHDPRILFMDEPTSGLDVRSQRLIKETMRDLNRDGRTIFLTTHNMVEANELCDRIAIINEGRIAAVDTPEALKSTVVRMQSVEVRFQGDRIPLHELESLSSVEEVKMEGEIFRLFTSDPVKTIEELVDLSRATGTRPSSMNVSGPSLEEVYLRLTGGER